MVAVPRSSNLPARTLELLDRTERGDREAAYDLTRIFRPDSVSELVAFVWTDTRTGPPVWLFDALCDAYAAWTET